MTEARAYLTRNQLVEEFSINTKEGWRRIPQDLLPYVKRFGKAIYKREDVIRYIETGLGKAKRGRPRNIEKHLKQR